MNEAAQAVEIFSGSANCSQAILAAWAPSLGLDVGQATRIAAGFGAGMRQRSLCGAVTGAFMVLGLAECGEDCVTREGRAGVSAAVDEFASRFQQRAGSLDCLDIVGCDVSTAEGMKTAHEQGLFGTKCAKAVRDAAEILEDMLERT
jgi:C_GCAxxG_C_C family probable redox protein